MTGRGKGRLNGVRVLVGRARQQASALSRELEALGAEVIEVPFIEICPPRSYKPLDSALKRAADYDWLILTSVNGVEVLAARMKQLHIPPSNLAHLKVAAIGPATRAGIEELGLTVAVTPKKFIAESVVESLRGKVDGARILLARAKVARDVIPRELRKAGAQVDVVEAYETVVPSESKTKLRSLMESPEDRPHIVCFTSSSTVRNFVSLMGERASASRMRSLEGVKLASIGPITSATLRACGLPVDIEAKEYTIPGLVRAIAGLTK